MKIGAFRHLSYIPTPKGLLVLKQINMKNKRENDKWLNTQPLALGIKNTIMKVGLKMLSAYNQKNSFVLIKGNIVMCVQPLYFVLLSPSCSGNTLSTTLDATHTTYNDDRP